MGQNQPVRPPCTWPKFAARVTLLAREHVRLPHHLAEGDPNIDVRLRTRVADGHDQARLEALRLEDVRTGPREQVPAVAVFVMIGAEPDTMALRPRQAERSWIHPDRPDVPPGAWPLPRPPRPFETSLPGVFAAGDVRYGFVKRVAGTAGERVSRSDPGFGIYAGLPLARRLASDGIRLLR